MFCLLLHFKLCGSMTVHQPVHDLYDFDPGCNEERNEEWDEHKAGQGFQPVYFFISRPDTTHLISR